MTLRPNPRSPFPYTRPPRPAPERGSGDRGRRWLRGIVSALAGLCLLAFIAYVNVARTLPSVDTLKQRAIPFRSTRILDREGGLLLETMGEAGGKRTVLRYQDIAPALVQATVATEDANFWRHPGVDPIALLRALWYALREGQAVSGGSTIPQQLVKRVYLSPERSLGRKLREAVLAAEVSRRYGKEDILTLYLNEIFYGNHAYGAEAAAQTYFGKPAARLSLAEAALLAGLPQAPAYHDPYSQPRRAKDRQAVVLRLMVQAGYVSAAEAAAAAAEPLAYQTRRLVLRAPHFSLLVRQQLEQRFGPDALDKLGLVVGTSLDPRLQTAAETAIRRNLAALQDRDVSNGALVAIRPADGQVLAYVGSADFQDAAIAGQVDMALAPRQPGSALKPFVYLAAMEQTRADGDAAIRPETLLADIERDFPDGGTGYRPRNYDGREHGLVTLRTALANSYNIPPVAMLQQVGVAPFLDLLRRLGISTLGDGDHGLAVALGAAELPLVELTGAYATLAAGGLRRPTVSILWVTDQEGRRLCGAPEAPPCEDGELPAEGRQLLDPVEAFLITDVLADNEARVPAFGRGSPLALGRPAAAKTGTTNDFRDNWTLGFTPQLAAGVWVGNADNRPMRGVSGITGAAPIWRDFLQAALADEPALAFPVPQGAQRFTVCAASGTLPGPACPATREAWFAADRPPLGAAADLHRRLLLDRLTGAPADASTPPERLEERIYLVYPPEWQAWAIGHSIPQPPTPAPTPAASTTATPSATATETPTARATSTATIGPTASAGPSAMVTTTTTDTPGPSVSATPVATSSLQ